MENYNKRIYNAIGEYLDNLSDNFCFDFDDDSGVYHYEIGKLYERYFIVGENDYTVLTSSQLCKVGPDEIVPVLRFINFLNHERLGCGNLEMSEDGELFYRLNVICEDKKIPSGSLIGESISMSAYISGCCMPVFSRIIDGGATFEEAIKKFDEIINDDEPWGGMEVTENKQEK